MCRTLEFACVLTQKAVHSFCLRAPNLWRDAASTIHHSLPTPAMPAPIVTPTGVRQWMKNTREKNNLLLSETQSGFQIVWGTHK